MIQCFLPEILQADYLYVIYLILKVHSYSQLIYPYLIKKKPLNNNYNFIGILNTFLI